MRKNYKNIQIEKKLVKLPIDNKTQKLADLNKIFATGILVFIVLYINSSVFWLIYCISAWFVIFALTAFILFKRNNIKEAWLSGIYIYIYYKSKIIKIPLNEIKEIHSGINYYLDLKGDRSKRYVLILYHKYYFGNRIILNFKLNSKLTINPDMDPKPIKYIKEKIDY